MGRKRLTARKDTTLRGKFDHEPKDHHTHYIEGSSDYKGHSHAETDQRRENLRYS